jgi:hypothetical protein
MAAVSCAKSKDTFDPSTFDPFTSVPAQMDVSSPDIDDGGTIPVKFTCDGENRTPVISWQRPPNGTQAVAVIFDDPDAPRGIFTHWVVFNLPPDQNRLSGPPSSDSRAKEGVTSFGDHAYGGPCPPEGETHEYRFNVFALIAPLALDADATATDVLTAMRGSVIGYGLLTASYTRS